MALLIKNVRIKSAVLIFFPVRICNADFDLFSGGSILLGTVSSGNFMENDGEGRRTLASVCREHNLRPSGGSTWAGPCRGWEGEARKTPSSGARAGPLLRQPWVMAQMEGCSAGICLPQMTEWSLVLRLLKLQPSCGSPEHPCVLRGWLSGWLWLPECQATARWVFSSRSCVRRDALAPR